jgi:hypothetical protein
MLQPASDLKNYSIRVKEVLKVCRKSSEYSVEIHFAIYIKTHRSHKKQTVTNNSPTIE